MDVSSVPQLVRNSVRFREVVGVLAKYGLADWLGGLRADWVQQIFQDADGRAVRDLTPDQRVREALTELGTTFIKLGQVLSTRPDLVGPELADELSELQSNTPADPPEVVCRILQDELQRPIESVFAEFSATPLASASVAQVHRATLFSGAAVVVKIQHDKIQERVRNDLEILIQLAELAEQVSTRLRQYQPKKTAEEFARTLKRELDFTREAGNLARFRQNFVEDPLIRFPAAHEESSSAHVLTMDFLQGISLTKKEALVEAGHDLRDLAERGAQMFIDMIFRDGFYHADPHPGNLMVLADGAIGVLDCGMVGQLEDDLREQIEDMVLAAVDRDSKRLADYVMRVGQVSNDVNRDELATDLDNFLADFGYQSIADFDLSGALTGIVRIIRAHHIVLPAKIGMLIKVLVMLEGTAQQLDPAFSLAELLGRYKEQAVRRRMSPQRLWNRLQSEARDWNDLVSRLPGDAADILDRVKQGSFDVHLDHRRLDSIVNRLVLGVVAAALFVGSTNLWSRQVPPLLRGYSIPGAAGCLFALVLIVKLLRAIKRSGNLDSS